MITIDPLTRIISVPQSFLTLDSGTIYEMDVNTFRLALKDIEDDPAGIYLQDTHNHTPPVTLSGSTYARFLEIINGYRIEFEDGQYQVNLVGANNNIVDVLIRNQVSVVANNSSGLIESDTLEFSSFIGEHGPQITVSALGEAGTEFPVGTLERPVDNLVDAITIAENRGINVLLFRTDFTIPSGTDVSFYDLYGESPTKTTLTVEDNSNTNGCELYDMTVTGFLDAIARARGVHFSSVTGTSNLAGQTILVEDCGFEGTITLSSGFSDKLECLNCYSLVAGEATPTFDLNGANVDLVVRNYAGGLQINNFSNTGQVGSIDMNSGQIILDSTCTDGTITVRGHAKLTNNSAGTTVHSTQLIKGDATTGVSKLIAANLIS